MASKRINEGARQSCEIPTADVRSVGLSKTSWRPQSWASQWPGQAKRPLIRRISSDDTSTLGVATFQKAIRGVQREMRTCPSFTPQAR